MKKATFILSIFILLILLGVAIVEKEVYPIPPKILTQSDLNGIHGESWKPYYNNSVVWTHMSANGNLKWATQDFIPQNAIFGEKEYYWEIHVSIYIFNNHTNAENYSNVLYKSEGPQIIYNESNTRVGDTVVNYTSGKWDGNQSSAFNQSNTLAVVNHYLIWIYTLTIFITPQTAIKLVKEQMDYFNESNPYI